MKTLPKALLIIAIAASALATAACNTTKGVGKDIENAGDGIKDAADRNGAD
jgi:predicted small secreted protein